MREWAAQASNLRLEQREQTGKVAVFFHTERQMKSVQVFDECHARYRHLRAELNNGQARIRPVALDRPASGYSWRPTRACACEYVADFERIGRNALRRSEWKGRLKLFETYFLQGVEYRRAIGLVGVAEGTFDYWFREVKRTVGAEFSRTRLFPPSRYFQGANQRTTGRAEQQGRRAESRDELTFTECGRDERASTVLAAGQVSV